ncbi:MAG: nuclear transport factor 2 family protein [Burkholderiales bacterium]|nr:nuclear transport factor 2 family protein [Burkholderiales bacterium]
MTTLDNLLEWYTTLTPLSVADITRFYNTNAHFKDPFNDVFGVENIAAIFTHMFETTENPRFVVVDRIEQNRQCFVTWVFIFRLRGKEYSINGGTHFVFDENGMVNIHRDYWDTAEELFQKLPIIGSLMRWLQIRFSVKF